MNQQPDTTSSDLHRVELTPSRALIILRVVWAALLMGQLIFMGVIAALPSLEPDFQADPRIGQIVFFASLAMLISAVPVGYFVRGQIYKKHWRDDVVHPMGYVLGNFFLLALCEGVALIGLTAAMLGGHMGYAAPGFIAMAVQVINFPHGRPMWPDHFVRNPPSR